MIVVWTLFIFYFFLLPNQIDRSIDWFLSKDFDLQFPVTFFSVNYLVYRQTYVDFKKKKRSMIELIKQLSIFPAPAVWKTIEYVSTSIWKISDRLFLLIDDSIEIHFLFPIMINNKTILSLIPFTMVITLSMNKAYSHSFSVIIIIDHKGIEFHTSEFYSIIKKILSAIRIKRKTWFFIVQMLCTNY